MLAVEETGHRKILLSPPYGAGWASSSAPGMGCLLGHLVLVQTPQIIDLLLNPTGGPRLPPSALIRSVISCIIALFLAGVTSRLSGPCKYRPYWVIAMASKCFSCTEKLSFLLLGAISPHSTQKQTDTKFKHNKQTPKLTELTDKKTQNRLKKTHNKQIQKSDSKNQTAKIRQPKKKKTSRQLLQIQTKNTEETDTKNTQKKHTATTTSYYNKSLSNNTTLTNSHRQQSKRHLL